MFFILLIRKIIQVFLHYYRNYVTVNLEYSFKYGLNTYIAKVYKLSSIMIIITYIK